MELGMVFIPVIPALRRQKQEDPKFQTTWAIARPQFKNNRRCGLSGRAPAL
jgi:hypothetical protein